MEQPPVNENPDKLSYTAVEEILREAMEEILGIMAEVVMDRVSRRWPGERLYVPVNPDNLSREQKETAIRAEFDGTNMGEVCRRHQISRSTFYRIIGQRRG
jgi:Mor family transcriptional regulator